MADEIHEGMQRALNALFTKKDGSPGEIEGAPIWGLSSSALATLVVAADGMSAKVQHNGSVGDVDWSMSADGDLGAGVFPIERSGTLSMLAPLGAQGATVEVGAEELIS